ncbi:MAG TPA: MarR family winged helix-turn-helix transcriptional regulator [Terriglobales bacterium]|nr:MarR family winged helix-turn-helix transcriptional regulator [Terriglobales bacterium]
MTQESVGCKVTDDGAPAGAHTIYFDESKHLTHAPAMLSPDMQRLFRAYPKIYLACHRQHLRDDESGRVLTAHMAGILDHLDPQNTRVISELARHMSVTESTMSLQVSKLEGLGYARRIRDRGDGRRIGVRLTAAGARVREQNSVLDPDLAKEMLSLLKSDDQETALRGLELLGGAAETLMEKRRLRRTKAAK